MGPLWQTPCSQEFSRRIHIPVFKQGRSICPLSPLKQVTRLGPKAQHALCVRLCGNDNDLLLSIQCASDLLTGWAHGKSQFTAGGTHLWEDTALHGPTGVLRPELGPWAWVSLGQLSRAGALAREGVLCQRSQIPKTPWLGNPEAGSSGERGWAGECGSPQKLLAREEPPHLPFPFVSLLPCPESQAANLGPPSPQSSPPAGDTPLGSIGRGAG